MYESCTLPRFAVKQLVLKSWLISKNIAKCKIYKENRR